MNGTRSWLDSQNDNPRSPAATLWTRGQDNLEPSKCKAPARHAWWLAVAATLFVSAATAAAPYPATMCPADRLATDLNCTANDVEVASVQVLNNVTTCIAGNQVDLHLQANLHANAQQRYNIGIFMAQDGKPTLLASSNGGSAVCSAFGLPLSPLPFANLDNNVCGDFDSSGLSQGQTTPLDLGTVTVTCTPDAEGYLDIPTIVTWNTNANTAGCQAPPVDWFVPESKSKCETGISQRIPVQVLGKIVVTKKTIPGGATGTFSYTASGPSASPTTFQLSDGQSQTVGTAPLGQTAQSYVISEQQLAGWAPGAQIVCTDKDGDIAPFVVVDNANRSITANMTVNFDQAFCEFTNTQQASITINKTAVGADGTFNFSGSPSIGAFPITTSNGSGQATFQNLAAGTYTVAETIPAGWDLTALVCTDPTSDSAVNLANGTATINLAPGENVSCTYTDTRRAQITVVKNTIGGDGSFNFTGPAGTFQINTSGGTGQVVLPNLVPGPYSVSESVPAGWDLTNLACVDPSGGTTTNANVASIGLAPGENVTCTFTDTKRGAIVVQKAVLGSDATFGFTGSQAFSITTAGGSGQNNSAFASVVPGQYTITESALAHYTLSALVCLDPTGNSATDVPSRTATVNVAAGETVTCTFTNTQLATLTIIKQAVPHVAQPNTQSFAFTASGPGLSGFSLSDDGTNPNSTTFPDLTPGGSYSVTETAVANWPLTSLTCTDQADPDPANRSNIDLANRTVTPNLQPGETLRCVFTNVRNDNGTIVVTKRTVGTLAAGTGGSFDFTNSGGSPGSPTNPSAFTITTTVQNPAGAQSLTGLAAAVYTITETPVASWDLAQPECVVTNGSNTTFQYTATSATITLGTTGGNVDAASCTFTNTHRAGITINKEATPKDAQDFTFTATGGNGVPASFALDDDADPTLPNTRSFGEIVPGVYTFTEQATAGWRLTAIACSGGSDVTTNTATGLTTVNLKAGETVNCTYRNAKDGTITINKVANGGSGGETFAFTGPPSLTGSIAGGGSLSGSFAAGTYSATELVPAGWDLTNIACSGGTVTITGASTNPTDAFQPGDTTVNITIASGEAVVCTYTDTKRGGITIVKNTIGGDGAFAFTGAQSFQIQTSAGTGQNSTAFASVPPGTYAVTESVPAGWNLTALTCSNASATNLGAATATVRLAAGESVTCTFTDTRQGVIRIIKRIDSENTTAFTFAVPTTMDGAGTFTLTPDVQSTQAERSFENLAPGTYSVTETPIPAGWKLIGLTCTDPTNNTVVDLNIARATINLAAGESVECTFEDTQLSSITISVVSSGGTGTFGFNTTNLGADSFSLTTPADSVKASRVFPDLSPGTYTSTGLGAQGWTLDNVLCVAQSGEQYWTIAGAHVAITLPHGEVIECTYYYKLIPPPPQLTPLPILAPWLYVLIGLLLLGIGSRKLRAR